MIKFEKTRLLLLVGVVLLFFCKETASACKQVTPCSCIFSDGQGYNLLELNNSRPLNVSANSYTFYFHPCANIPLPNTNQSECSQGNGVSLCAQQGNTTFNLGTTEETSIIAEPDNTKEPPLLMLHHKHYQTSIVLICCSVCDTHLVFDTVKSNSEEYHLLLVSPYACKTFMGEKGLSIGSLLLVYFFVLVMLYFLGGILISKLITGATGWEMIPNHTFWRDLPSLIHDGITFTFNCCSVTTYDQI